MPKQSGTCTSSQAERRDTAGLRATFIATRGFYHQYMVGSDCNTFFRLHRELRFQKSLRETGGFGRQERVTFIEKILIA